MVEEGGGRGEGRVGGGRRGEEGVGVKVCLVTTLWSNSQRGFGDRRVPEGGSRSRQKQTKTRRMVPSNRRCGGGGTTANQRPGCKTKERHSCRDWLPPETLPGGHTWVLTHGHVRAHGQSTAGSKSIKTNAKRNSCFQQKHALLRGWERMDTPEVTGRSQRRREEVWTHTNTHTHTHT